MEKIITNQRSEYDIPEHIAYLNCAFMSPLAKDVMACGQQSVALKMRPWEVKTDDFFTLIETTKKEYARLLNTDSKNIALIPSVSYGLAIAEKNVPTNNGNSVLVLEDQFPSNFYIWQSWCKKNNKELIVVPKKRNVSLTQSILDRLNSNVSVAALPQVHWCDGAWIDLEQISAAAQRYNISLVIDGTQSVGAMPFSVPKIKPDFLIVANYKWMMGPYSVSFAYIDPKYHRGEPLEHVWLNKQGCSNFKNLVDYQDDFLEGAVRFDVGQKSNFALLPMCTLATKKINDLGVQNISNYIKSLNERLINQCSHLNLKTWSNELRAPHILGIELADQEIAKLTEAFAKNNIFISFRGNTLRVSPNLYNTNADIDKIADVLSKNL